jgi:hypothetical protein
MSSKKQARAKSKARQARRKWLKWQVVTILAGAALLVGAWITWRQAELPGRHFESQGRAHIPDGSPSPAYNSSPPTSGPHAGAARWGAYTMPIPEINQVHNLEHGGILIQYNCASLPPDRSCTELQTRLRAVYDTAVADVDPKIVLAPYPRMESLVAVTAWTWLATFDTVDGAGILAFARAHVNQAPERVDE